MLSASIRVSTVRRWPCDVAVHADGLKPTSTPAVQRRLLEEGWSSVGHHIPFYRCECVRFFFTATAIHRKCPVKSYFSFSQNFWLQKVAHQWTTCRREIINQNPVFFSFPNNCLYPSSALYWLGRFRTISSGFVLFRKVLEVLKLSLSNGLFRKVPDSPEQSGIVSCEKPVLTDYNLVRPVCLNI